MFGWCVMGDRPVWGWSVRGVLLEALAALRPALAPLLPRCANALNGSLVAAGSLLADGDRLDLLPPVSGG